MAALEIKESDWKVFRKLHGIALERFCERVLEELKSAASGPSGSYHETYLNVFELIQTRNQMMARIFDDPRRSAAIVMLADMKHEGLLTEEEWMQFSPKARDSVQLIEDFRARYK